MRDIIIKTGIGVGAFASVVAVVAAQPWLSELVSKSFKIKKPAANIAFDGILDGIAKEDSLQALAVSNSALIEKVSHAQQQLDEIVSNLEQLVDNHPSTNDDQNQRNASQAS